MNAFVIHTLQPGITITREAAKNKHAGTDESVYYSCAFKGSLQSTASWENVANLLRIRKDVRRAAQVIEPWPAQ